ncbi:LOW QUALITY PROTEIN: olfactory receptor 2D3 [Phyllostomus hastatus]|uniref:LOW QUALITY PROTEIN: olfactory receptor 2D3 n=1 Tax=Phyllostomus hastatus TaxID=9423 RepID=UPI001E683035|nr:LOW QUALITY PROTEIN: olfactory receptor 2D3 [Phyllostomus hastatus]
MGEENQTFVSEFIFLSLSQDLQTQILLFILFFIIYLLTVLGNLLIIILIFVDSRLHTPMYFLLRNLSFTDLCFSTSIVPQVLVHFLVNRKNYISFRECMAQIIVFFLIGCTECALLAVMSYDWYVAVCKPLHYYTIVTQQVCLQLAVASWASGTVVSLVDTTFTFQLPYPEENIINHYFCEPPALLKLASADTCSTEMAIFAMGVVILLAPVSLILVSCWHIISTVIQMQSGESRLKAFSTCGSHLFIVLFYGSGIFTYIGPNSKTTKERDKIISVFYTVVMPMLNPIIDSLRNKDIKGALRKLTTRKTFSHRQ